MMGWTLSSGGKAAGAGLIVRSAPDGSQGKWRIFLAAKAVAGAPAAETAGQDEQVWQDVLSKLVGNDQRIDGC